jgi:hypothetical protein
MAAPKVLDRVYQEILDFAPAQPVVKALEWVAYDNEEPKMSEMTDHSKTAAVVAAAKTGLRPDQIIAAVEEYRSALADVEAEPQWRSLSHFGGQGMGIAQYTAEGTGVVLQVDSWAERGKWKSERSYTFGGKAYETYAEARSAEAVRSVKFEPREVRDTIIVPAP